MPSAALSTLAQTNNKPIASFNNQKNIEDAEKENIPIGSQDKRKHNDKTDKLLVRDVCAESPYPQTPASRIPLQDLIGNTEDALNCPQPVTTPGDHVRWQNGPDSSAASESVNGTQKSRKRAHSSSPVSSQLERSAHFRGQNDPMNLESIQKSLRTPNNDPGQDLWNQYMNTNMAKADNSARLLQFAHLFPSSPQTPGASGKDGGLRRTASCGVEWPTSKPKRRKLDHKAQLSRTRDIFTASKVDLLAHDLPNPSKVSLLMEKIQESLSKRAIPEQAPSSSSPLPERFSQIPVSPSKTVNLAKVLQTSGSLASSRQPPNIELETINSAQELSSSEFGDEGVDLEYLETVERNLAEEGTADLNPDSIHNEIPVNGAAGNELEETTSLQQTHQIQDHTYNQHERDNVQMIQEPSFDEFNDDDDDELFTAELQQLAAKYESQGGSNTASNLEVPETNQAPMDRLDDFADAFDDDEELWEAIADQSVSVVPSKTGSISQSNLDNRAIKRYYVLDVLESQYQNSHGRTRPEKMLSLRDERTKMLRVVYLRQSWYETRCTKGSYVHIIGEFSHKADCVVDDENNMIILHPDHLISSTVVGDSFTCLRRAALQDRVKATSQATAPQVYGHILHEVFGEALRLNQWDSESFNNIIQKIIPHYLESLYEIGVTMAAAREYLLSKTPELAAWASVFVGERIVNDAAIRDRNGALVPTAVTKLLELEEHIWSPMYGLKGNVDATVEAQMQLPEDSITKTLVAPLELKTGKRDNVEAHRAQTALYTLLLSDRYDVNVTSGILYYMETSKTFRIESVRNEIRHMIIQRNELACYVHDKLDLPPMIKRPHMCKSCYSKTQCFTYHKLIEDGDATSSGLGETFNEMVDHLKPSHKEFFKKWDDLLTREERDSMKFRRELWTMLSKERQEVGRCFSNLIIQPGTAQENEDSPKINRFEYTMVKHRPEPGFSFTESQITIGEPIVVSDEQGHFNLACGFVTNVRPSRIVVTVDRRLQNARRKRRGFDSEINQVFTGLMESAPDGTPLQLDTDVDAAPQLFRVDKDEFQNGMATARNNIIRIMEKDLFRARELRQLIIDGEAPRFNRLAPAYQLSGPASQQSLNVDQRRAIEKVMSAQDYALVLGMPGTGKTTTIAHIIRALVMQNKSVLLASYTHTAVDNILLKIKDDGIPILRIGSVSKVHPEVQSFVDLTGVPKKTLEELHQSWHNSKVVATTCLSVTHALFNARIFDYCIVDEASQITLPVCLGPIRMAKTFILVGDHYQLPPLVQNKEAQEGGLDISLFKLLSDMHPESVVNLEHQYRMAEDIMLLSKELVYNGRLKCGTEAVAKRMLSIPSLENGLAAHHHTADTISRSAQPITICTSDSSCWLRQALSPRNRCLFLNTDTILPVDGARETVSRDRSRTTNTAESALTTHLVTTLIKSGVPPRSIGVIAFYRAQLALLRHEMKAVAGTNATAEIEMHTADKYQGRDKEVVILSCVHSNENHHVGELLKDWRRVNVAVTRARSKLIIIGSKRTLGGSDVPILTGIVEIMNGRGWISDLPGNALQSHLFENSQFTQTPAPKRIRSSVAISTTNRSPLLETNGNHWRSPTRNPATKLEFRKPSKIVQGKIPLNMDKLLDARPVMKDIMQGIEFGGIIDSSPAEMEVDLTDFD